MADKSRGSNGGTNLSEAQQRQVEEDAAKEIERKQEASKAAQKAIYAKKKAKELVQAARGAGDPDERQKLLNEALEKEVEAETFGKTAKYLQSGAFQGMLAGTGLGGGIGVWLGVVTGTLVGGTTGLLTGGIGAGVGAGVGAIHGPFVKVGHLMGDGIRKITGDIPGWKATKEQKAALEKMVNGVQNQEAPDDDELELIRAEGAAVQDQSQSWKEAAASHMPFKSAMPSVPGLKSSDAETSPEQKKTPPTQQKPAAPSKIPKKQAGQSVQNEAPTSSQSEAVQSRIQPGQAISSTAAHKNTPGAGNKPTTGARPSSSTSSATRPTPARQVPDQASSRPAASTASTGGANASETKEAPKKKPRKLEVRSASQSNASANKRTVQRASN